ncbi:pilus assembly protein PilP [Vibrio tapetis]|uniref:Putative Pilus assembly protein PilP n=1 Tax=Vibrio tapetis subsp. tapetis TaxID=1671868 RepID=A0A2N8ZG87_9VIBR|nr:pilus assembly protein PilP [Vibrio tapetis]SON50932.1 putative Pilus assembly protein PilP [Vibrio tapetis subsp. tapetis]
MRSKQKGIIVVVGVWLLVGCQVESEPIDVFIAQSRLNAKAHVSDLKQVHAFKAIQFDAGIKREPFVLPEVAKAAVKPHESLDCWQPKARSKRSKLEQYPLEQLRLNGVMGSGGRLSGIIHLPTGIMSKVTKGNYIGRNNGKVVEVTNQYVLVQEVLPDGLGCWQKRQTKLSMNSARKR